MNSGRGFYSPPTDAGPPITPSGFFSPNDLMTSITPKGPPITPGSTAQKAVTGGETRHYNFGDLTGPLGLVLREEGAPPALLLVVPCRLALPPLLTYR